MSSEESTVSLAPEHWGALQARTDILTAADGGRFAATCITAVETALKRRPVILIPGMFSNRHFWLSPRGVGLAATLAGAGYPVWLIERRGLGRSPQSTAGIPAGLEQHLRLDLPALQQHVSAHTPGKAVWGGHSFGGVITARAAAETLDPSQIAGLLLFAAQIEVGKSMLCWPRNLFLRALSRLFGRLPARRMGLGPEDEPIAAVDDACKWRMNTQRNGGLLSPLSTIQCPVLAFAGAADQVDPPSGCRKLIGHMGSVDKRFVLLAESEGYRQDYDHPGIVVSKPAAQEVWPQVLAWVQGLSSASTA